MSYIRTYFSFFGFIDGMNTWDDVCIFEVKFHFKGRKAVKCNHIRFHVTCSGKCIKQVQQSSMICHQREVALKPCEEKIYVYVYRYLKGWETVKCWMCTYSNTIVKNSDKLLSHARAKTPTMYIGDEHARQETSSSELNSSAFSAGRAQALHFSRSDWVRTQVGQDHVSLLSWMSTTSCPACSESGSYLTFISEYEKNVHSPNESQSSH